MSALYLVAPVVVIAAGAAVTTRAVAGMRVGFASRRWAERSGAVVAHDSAGALVFFRSVAVMLPGLAVRYAYTVDGQRFEGTTAADHRMTRVNGFLRRLDALRPGDPVPVFVDPSRPERSTLILGTGGWAYAHLITGLALIGGALIWLARLSAGGRLT